MYSGSLETILYVKTFSIPFGNFFNHYYLPSFFQSKYITYSKENCHITSVGRRGKNITQKRNIWPIRPVLNTNIRHVFCISLIAQEVGEAFLLEDVDLAIQGTLTVCFVIPLAGYLPRLKGQRR